MGRNYKRAYRPEYNEPKNLHRRAAHKKTPYPNSEQPRKVEKPQQNSRKKNPSRTHQQPTYSPMTDPILPQQGRGEGASRTMP